MQKKIFSLIAALTLILSSLGPMKVFAATEQQLAVFSYTAPTGTLAEDNLTNGDKDSGYTATSGVFKSSAKLFASVDGKNPRKLEWSKPEYSYGGSSGVMVPVMAAGKKNPWGSKPYFEIQCSTAGYENIKFSAKINGTNSGPANYKLQYSTDRTNYSDVVTAPEITSNKKLTSNLFDNTALPQNASDKQSVYLRIIATNTTTIGNTDFSGDTGGEAAINDVIISGTSKAAEIPTLAAPSANIESGEIYGNTTITLSCSTSSAAQIKYTVNGGTETEYTGEFMPFENVSGTTAVIRTWASQDGYKTSSTAVYTYTCTKDEITSFDFSNAGNIDYVNGEIKATSGIYPIGRITASLDGVNKYSPLYSNEENAIAISPDDTYTWHKGGYWQIEFSTAGYNKIYMSTDAFSTNKGPASMTLQYSTDGVAYTELYKNKVLPVSDTGTYYSDYQLPADAANRQKIYIRLVTEENKRADTTDTYALFDNESKGNTYINKVIFSGTRTDTLKMPYTTKATTYFGQNGTISYTSPDNAEIKYSIYTKNGTAVIENELYDSTAQISLASLPIFDAQLCNEFRIDAWAESGTQKSLINSQLYTFKGVTVAAFEYDTNNGTTVSGTDVQATFGNATLSMYPNGADKTTLSYNSKTKALRAEADIIINNNPWNFDTTRKNPDKDGYWLITLSTKGYKDIKFSADQLSTEKGPRDYSISYSTDGKTYKPLADSSVRMTESLNSTYTNVSLPAEADNKDKIFIKIKIDGGETLSGAELTSDKDDPDTSVDENVYGKGNTDINNIEICGTKIENKISIEGNPEYIEKGKTYYINFITSIPNPAIIAAGYNNNGEMVFCNTNTNIVNIPSDSTAAYIKVMLWENVNTLVPLTPAIKKSVQ
ncbi:MAG: hypothetical protein SOZ34_04030 [Clostridia bacterium]|nr:hypothetical protein [Clostridia bacterium]